VGMSRQHRGAGQERPRKDSGSLNILEGSVHSCKVECWRADGFNECFVVFHVSKRKATVQ